MALPVVVGPEIRSQACIRRDADLRRFVKPDPRAHHSGEARRCNPGGFHVARETEPAQPATPRRSSLALLETRRELECPLEDLGKIAAVVGRPYGCLVGHCGFRDEIAPADLCALDAEFEGSLVREP